MTTALLLQRMGEGLALSQQGARAEARQLLEALWHELEAHPEPLVAMGVAHALADLQDEVTEELRWDLAALQAAEQLTDAALAAAGMIGGREGLYPSLYLNLADVSRRAGQPQHAVGYARLCREAVARLEPGEYRSYFEAALSRLEERLG